MASSETVPDGVEERLRLLDRLAAEQRAEEIASGAMATAVRQARTGARASMDPQEIDRRLRVLGELRELCLELGRCGPGR